MSWCVVCKHVLCMRVLNCCFLSRRECIYMSVFVCIYRYTIYTCIHPHAHTHTHTHTAHTHTHTAHTHTPTHARTPTRTHTRAHAPTHARTRAHAHTHTPTHTRTHAHTWSPVPGCYPPPPRPAKGCLRQQSQGSVLVFGGWDRHRDVKSPIGQLSLRLGFFSVTFLLTLASFRHVGQLPISNLA